MIVVGVISLIGLVLLLPGILVNTVRGRYKARPGSLISSALRDWQTWLISLPFAVPILVISVHSWNEALAKQAVVEQRLENLITQSKTETRTLAHIPLVVDYASSFFPFEMEITDVSIKLQYTPEDKLKLIAGDLPSLLFFRDLPRFYADSTKTVNDDPLITFENRGSIKFDSIARRNDTLNILKEAVKAWQEKFPEALTPSRTRSPIPESRPPSAEPEVRRAELAAPINASPAASEVSKTRYSVIGVIKDDTLNVRAGPGTNYDIVARLPNGYTGLRTAGAPMMNGTTEWVKIIFGTRTGWVTKLYLQPE